MILGLAIGTWLESEPYASQSDPFLVQTGHDLKASKVVCLTKAALFLASGISVGVAQHLRGWLDCLEGKQEYKAGRQADKSPPLWEVPSSTPK